MSKEEAVGSFIKSFNLHPDHWPIISQKIDDIMTASNRKWEEDDEGNMEDSYTEESDDSEDEIEMEDSFWTTTIPAEMSFEGEESDSDETNSSEGDYTDSTSDDEMKTMS